MLNTYLRPFKRARGVIGPWLWLAIRLWNEAMLEAGKYSIQSSNEGEANEDSGQEAIACGRPPRRNRRVTRLIPTLHDVLDPS